MKGEILAKNLTKVFDGEAALKDLTFSLSAEPGEIIGMLGENGVGKSTLLNLIAGLYVPTGGTIEVGGIQDSKALRNQVSFLLEPSQVHTYMTPKGLIQYYRDHFKDFDEKMGYDLINSFEIPLKKPIHKLSKGQQEKVCLAVALSRRVSLYIMDEPASGFDPKFKRGLVKIILAHLPQEANLLIATHLLRDLDTLFDKVLILKPGAAVIMGTETIRETHQSLEEYYLEVIA